MRDHPIVDIDTHLTDASPEPWRPYLTGTHADLVPRVVDHGGTNRLLVGDLLLPKPDGSGVGSPLGTGATTHVVDLDERVAHLDRTGTRTAYLLPGFVGLAALQVVESRARRALVHAHNALVHDLSVECPAIAFVPVVVPEDAEWSVAELQRWQSTEPVRAVVSRPTTTTARPYEAGLANPLLRHLADSRTVLMLHGATGYHQVSPVADLFDDYRFSHVFSHPFEQMVALADLFGSGALQEGLRVAVVEAGCGWVPWFFDRLQSHFDHTGGCEPIPQNVADTAARQLLIGVEPTDPGIEAVGARYGYGFLAFGSDYPHWDAASEEEIRAFATTRPAETARPILHDNAYHFFAHDG